MTQSEPPDLAGVGADMRAEWRAETESFAGKMRGSIVPPDMLDLALRERAAFRQQQKH